MNSHGGADPPVILFGAFDRHNFGDLLLPHVAAALLPGRRLTFAGLAAGDLRRHGGHRLQAAARLAADWRERPPAIIHVGGELLTCTAWQAAAMLLPPSRAAATIARLDAQAEERQAWARRQLGIPDLAPYTLGRELFPHAAGVIYNAVGGVDLGGCAPALRDEVLAKLKAADAVSVRDRETLAQLDAAGIAAALVPDPAVMVAELFATTIARHAAAGPAARIRATFPQGYVALQFSADFGDDRTLDEIAGQLERMTTASGYGAVFFRAGAAPWHDDLSAFRRLAARMPKTSVAVFTSLHIWDICALIAGSRAYCGSSLHGRIVAAAFALPRVNLRHPAATAAGGKADAFAASWEAAEQTATVGVDDIARGIERALATDPEQRRRTAAELAGHYRRGFAAICAGR